MNGVENLPKSNTEMVDENRMPAQQWYRMFERFFALPVRETVITLTGSPFTYQATKDGFVIVSAGTVSNIAIARGLTSAPTIYSLGVTTGQVVLKRGDVLYVTYSVAPSMAFYPD